MSLVNDMLEDLARRAARRADRSAELLAGLRPVSRRVRPIDVSARRALAGGALMGFVLGGAILLARSAEEPALPDAAARVSVSVMPPTAVLAAGPPEPAPPAKREPERLEPPMFSPPPLPERAAAHRAAFEAADAPFDAEPGRPPPAPLVEKQRRPPTPAERAGRMHDEALALVGRGESEAARALLRRALEADPTHAVTRRTLVSLLVRDQRHDQALELAEQGLARDPHQPALTKAAARLRVDRGDTETALRLLEVAPPPLHADPELHAFRAALHQRLGNHARAADLYGQVLRREPRRGSWWMGLGISLEAQGRSADAERAYRTARAARSLSPAASRWLDERLHALEETP